MSFVFNTSFDVSDLLQREWEEWLCQEMIPAVKASMPGMDVEVFEVVSVSQENSSLFSVQWRCANFVQVQNLDEYMAGLLATVPKQFGEQVTHFSSVMKKR